MTGKGHVTRETHACKKGPGVCRAGKKSRIQLEKHKRPCDRPDERKRQNEKSAWESPPAVESSQEGLPPGGGERAILRKDTIPELSLKKESAHFFRLERNGRKGYRVAGS